MASKRAQRRKACAGKVRHPTFEDAIIAARRSKHPGLNAYRCQFCGSAHIGHPPRHVRQTIASRREDQC